LPDLLFFVFRTLIIAVFYHDLGNKKMERIFYKKNRFPMGNSRINFI